MKNNKILKFISILSFSSFFVIIFNSFYIYAEDKGDTGLTITERAVIASIIIAISIPLLIVFKTKKINNIKRLKHLQKNLTKIIETIRKNDNVSTRDNLKVKSALNSIRQSIYSELANSENYQMELLNSLAGNLISNFDNLIYKTIFDKENADYKQFIESLSDFNQQLENILNHYA